MPALSFSSSIPLRHLAGHRVGGTGIHRVCSRQLHAVTRRRCQHLPGASSTFSTPFIASANANDNLNSSLLIDFSVACGSARAFLHEHSSSSFPFSSSQSSAAHKADDIDINLLSNAYGHVLARDARAVRNAALVPFAAAVAEGLLQTAISSERYLPDISADGAHLESFLRGNIPADNRCARAYGAALGAALCASRLGLKCERVANALEEGLCKERGSSSSAGKGEFPMDAAEYDRQFAAVERRAQAVCERENLALADSLFEKLRRHDCVRDVEGDGFVLAWAGDIDMTTVLTSEIGVGKSEMMDMQPCVAELYDETLVVLEGRFLDGRQFVVPTFEEGSDVPDFVRISLQDVPVALARGVQGLKEGEYRSLFLHPYAAHDVTELFGERQQFPPAVGMVFEIYLHKIL